MLRLRSFLLFPFAALVLAGCGGGGEETQQADPALPVEVLVVEPRAFTEDIRLTGEVEALQDVTLTAQAAGTVRRIAPLGAVVSEGAVLARLESDEAEADVAEAEAAIRSARAALERARDRYGRLEPLAQDTIVAPIEFEGAIAERDQAAASVRQAEARLERAREALENTRLTAPFRGQIEEQFVEEGEQVQRGQEVVRLVSDGEVRVRAGVPESYVGEVEVGAEVTVQLRGPRGGVRRGRIDFVGAAVNPQGQTFPIEVALPPDTRLRPGQVVRIDVPLRTLDDALVVPRTAVVRDERGEAVFIVERAPDSLRTAQTASGENGESGNGENQNEENGGNSASRSDTTRALVAYRRPVVLGPGSGGLVTVTRGLQPYEEVVVLGSEDLTGGELVRVENRYRRAEAASTPLGPEYDAGGLADPSGTVPPAAPGPDRPGYAPPQRPPDGEPDDAGGRR
jgi:RND family efflux transporter MFP subunit